MRGVGGSARGWLRLCGGGPGRGGRRAMAEAAALMGQRIVWVDLEWKVKPNSHNLPLPGTHWLCFSDPQMTGLDIEKDQILEMACLITDSGLNILAEGPNLIINQPDELLDGMSDWCKEHHGKSGLTKAVKESTISLRQAEYEIALHSMDIWLQCTFRNSVHADKKFLDKHMPQFMKHLHYRIIDVSTLKELCRRWYPEDYEIAPKKSASHRKTSRAQGSLPAEEKKNLSAPLLSQEGDVTGSQMGQAFKACP
ncbi:hypothetical protein Chor_005724 [Crotalus horridus]